MAQKCCNFFIVEKNNTKAAILNDYALIKFFVTLLKHPTYGRIVLLEVIV